MSATATRERALARDASPPAGAGEDVRLFEPASGSVSLDDAIVGVWMQLTASGTAGCPVCGGRMGLTAGCEDCGSDLS